jgi:hypothetical protein
MDRKEALGNQRSAISGKEVFSCQESAISQSEAFSNQHSAFSQNQGKNQNQKQQPNRFTAENTEDTERGNTATRRRAEELVRRIGEACDELERLAEENPGLVGRVTRGSEEHKEAYLRLKARLALADQAPRCRWIRQDGTGCGSPQMKKHIYCFAHKQMLEAQALALRLPAEEDANAIQIGIMRIQKALIEGAISTKMAGLLLYSMQLALQNVGQVTFGQAKAEELARETVSVEQAVREDLGTGSSGHGDSEPSTTQDTERSKSSPLMNGDDADQQQLEEEFVPLPGGAGYRFTAVRMDTSSPRPAQGAQPGAPPPQNAQNRRAAGAPVG